MAPCEKPTGNMAEFSWEEIKRHDKEGDAWVVMDGKVFNVSKFLNDHPGGSSIVLGHLGSDIGDVWNDEDYHSHSESAKKILQQYHVGFVEGECRGDAGTVHATEKMPHQGKGGAPAIPTAGGFPVDIDWDQPIVFQVGKLGTNYNEFVHDPKMLGEPARFFKWDFFEFFSRTPWYVVPIVWFPVVLAMCHYTTTVGLTPGQAIGGWVAGVFAWTLIEYVLHRWVFHLDEFVQFSYLSITIHFLLHGVHHKLPQDAMRLVFPPVLTSIFLYLVLNLFRTLMPDPWGYAVTSGGLTGYIGYDLCHYYLHHSGVPPLSYFGRLKKYHLAHHYKDPNMGYGITSKAWDYVFNTVLDENGPSKLNAAKTH